LDRENQLMERIGFFATEVHMAEHARILELLEDVQSQLDAGEVDTVREFVEHDLPEWFLRHLASMDSATAQFAQQRGES
ncbi:MAG TPA: hemerythrin family protein, partial [Magnetovibrio sp.]